MGRTAEDLEEYGKAQAEGFAQRLDLPHGLPGPDTFRRVLSRVAPEAWTQCFSAWTRARRDLSGGAIVSSDGKTLRHAFAQATSQAALHMVKAWANANRLGLGQVKVADKSHDIPAIPKRLTLRDLAGAPGTIAAMGCQKDIAQVRTDQPADYVVALTENPPTRYAEVTLLLDDARASAFAALDQASHATVAGDHGRIETRRYWITSAMEWFGATASWSNVQRIGMGESRRDLGNEVESETRYFVTSLPADGVRFAQAVRQHWGIENSLPWGREVSFDEDACRIRKDKGAQTCSVLRHIAVNLLRRENAHQRGIKARRKRAGWDRGDLLQVLTG